MGPKVILVLRSLFVLHQGFFLEMNELVSNWLLKALVQRRDRAESMEYEWLLDDNLSRCSYQLFAGTECLARIENQHLQNHATDHYES